VTRLSLAAARAQRFFFGLAFLAPEPIAAVVGVETDLDAIVLTAAANTTCVAVPHVVIAIVHVVNAIQLVVPAHRKAEPQVRSVYGLTATIINGEQIAIDLEPQFGRQDIPFGNITIQVGQVRRRPVPSAKDEALGNVRRSGRCRQRCDGRQCNQLLH
jgi:hypothetical protein